MQQSGLYLRILKKLIVLILIGWKDGIFQRPNALRLVVQNGRRYFDYTHRKGNGRILNQRGVPDIDAYQ